MKAGDIVKITEKNYGHKYSIGEKVRILNIDGNILICQGLNSGREWSVHRNEISNFKNKDGKPKNLILKKSLPTININGIMYKRPKGTVYKWNDGCVNQWQLLDKGSYITEKDYESNKDWYGLTTKKPTYEVLRIGDDVVKFEKGEIKVGCNTISNEMVRKIAKKLIK